MGNRAVGPRIYTGTDTHRPSPHALAANAWANYGAAVLDAQADDPYDVPPAALAEVFDHIQHHTDQQTGR
jgi:hypothetical protein